MTPQELSQKLKEAPFGPLIEEYDLNFDHCVCIIKSSNLVALCNLLKDNSETRFNYLSDICGVDFYPKQPRFEVVYHMYSLPHKHRLRLKCRVSIDEPVPTVTTVWPTANWQEREAFDMYGIPFDGHPDLRRIYMWDEFEGYPMRKDFPLRGYKDHYNPYGEE